MDMHSILSAWIDMQNLLYFLSCRLVARFRQTENRQDLDWAIAVARLQLDYVPFSFPDRWSPLANLACSRYERYEKWGDFADLERAIVLWRDAVKLCPQDNPSRFDLLDSLAISLSLRNRHRGTVDDLDEIIEVQRASLTLVSKEEPKHFKILNDLADALRARFEESGGAEDLEESIQLYHDALRLVPEQHPDRPTVLSNLGGVLITRFWQNREAQDMDESINLHRKALNLRPEGHSFRSDSLNNLGGALQTRYQWSGSIEDLNESIHLLREALALRPEGHPNRSSSLNNLAGALKARFGQSGRIEDLNESIQLFRDTLTLWPEGHSLRSIGLGNLGYVLHARFEERGWENDLNESIQLQLDSLALRPEGHPDRCSSLTNLATALWTRFEQNERIQDLDESIQLHRAVLALHPEGHPDQGSTLESLGGILQTRFRQSGRSEDLNESLQFHLAALARLPEGHPERQSSLSVFAGVLLLRAVQNGSKDDLDEALAYLRDSLALLPNDHPNYSLRMANISTALYTRFKMEGHAEDFDESIHFLRQTAAHRFSNLLFRLKVALQWTTMARCHDHSSTLEAYRVTSGLLDHALAIRPTLVTRHDFLKSKKDYLSLGVDAASYTIEKGDFSTAIEILERGRALLWSQLRGFRTPLGQLLQVNKPLADRFRDVGYHLESLITSSEPSNSGGAAPGRLQSRSFHELMEHVRRLSEEQEMIINEIREVPGFENFLRTVSFEKLQKAASEGPVIVLNHSQFRCDALMLLSRSDEPCVNVPLDDDWFKDGIDLCLHLVTRRFGYGEHSPMYDEALRRIMSTLWDRVVSEVVQKLKDLEIAEGTRIWWCPTSYMSWFPFHATGPYRNEKGEARYLLDDYISSYAPTLTSIIVARSGLRVGMEKFLFVGDTKLAGTMKELHAIRKWHRVGTRLLGDQASPDSVMKALHKVEWAHFACHGKYDMVELFKSSLALPGGALTLLDIARARLPNAQFAFLSACHTAEPALSTAMDEVLNLAAAIQFCGFRSVVGTMWKLLDRDGPLLAEAVYMHLMNDAEDEKFRFKGAAAAVRQAALYLRSQKDWTDDGREVDIAAERWVNLVHIGA